MTPVTPLSVFAASCDATIRPHPATEPVAGVAEGGAIVVEPGPVWQSLDDLMGDTGRTDTSAVVLLAPELHRAGYMPNLIATTSIITPAVPVGGSTVLHQVHVTTFADQISHHTTALAAARIA